MICGTMLTDVDYTVVQSRNTIVQTVHLANNQNNLAFLGIYAARRQVILQLSKFD